MQVSTLQNTSSAFFSGGVASFNVLEVRVDGSHPLKKVEEVIRMYRDEEELEFFTLNKKKFLANSGYVFYKEGNTLL